MMAASVSPLGTLFPRYNKRTASPETPSFLAASAMRAHGVSPASNVSTIHWIRVAHESLEEDPCAPKCSCLLSSMVGRELLIGPNRYVTMAQVNLQQVRLRSEGGV